MFEIVDVGVVLLLLLLDWLVLLLVVCGMCNFVV